MRRGERWGGAAARTGEGRPTIRRARFGSRAALVVTIGIAIWSAAYAVALLRRPPPGDEVPPR